MLQSHSYHYKQISDSQTPTMTSPYTLILQYSPFFRWLDGSSHAYKTFPDGASNDGRFNVSTIKNLLKITCTMFLKVGYTLPFRCLESVRFQPLMLKQGCIHFCQKYSKKTDKNIFFSA